MRIPARCIECRAEFNRKVSADKLRCPKCLEPVEPPDPKWKDKLKKVKGK